jgi:NADH-quinone oxidoreductase subunit L
MLIPLVVLAILSLIGGWVGVPHVFGGHNEIEHFLDPIFDPEAAQRYFASGTETLPLNGSHVVEVRLAILSIAVACLGLCAAYVLYIRKPGTSTKLATSFKPVYTLLENKFYVDEIYAMFIVTPLMVFSRLFLAGLVDGGVASGVPSATAAGVRGLGSLTRKMQSGNIRSYAGWLALGAAAVLVFMIFIHVR